MQHFPFSFGKKSKDASRNECELSGPIALQSPTYKKWHGVDNGCSTGQQWQGRVVLTHRSVVYFSCHVYDHTDGHNG